MKIDLKSALFGLVLGILAVVAVGAAEGDSQPINRFQCAAGGELLMVVDSATGKTWVLRPNGVSITGAPGGFFDPKR